MDLVTLDGQTNDVMLLTLVVTVSFGGGHVPQATLFAPSGAALDTWNATAQRQFTLPEDGVYIVEVRASNLTNTGSYDLSLECAVP